ncbi:hypothetical protein HELRODRAFT_183200 [Helobdella robusta]|uniref:Uncharacterized protein n=1 Tax=Helobdella robusta TaxID=6412 RepID=T1FJA5_HELRO|nr:hypothetical protein HELRODRAFT_183200 [Helobdella robusta]ESO11414.1 hypothetical protein HELRODRAFT_183200 [Helobdella robusta]
MRSLYFLMVVCLLKICYGEIKCPKSFKYTLKLNKEGKTEKMDLPLTRQDSGKCIYEGKRNTQIEGQVSDEPGKKIVWSGKFRVENFGYTLELFTGQWICPIYCVHTMIDGVDYVVCDKITVY